MAALLRDAGVIDDEDGVRATHEAVSYAGKLRFEWPLPSQAVGKEVVKAVVSRRIEVLGMGCMLLRSPGPIRPDTSRGHFFRSFLCPSRTTNSFGNILNLNADYHISYLLI